jgi:hypothetical protein
VMAAAAIAAHWEDTALPVQRAAVSG